MSCTDYKLPVFKLRFATNRKMAMHGDDIVGVKFYDDGRPKALVVVEVKNYSSAPKVAVKKASEGLLTVEKGIITLLDFIVTVLKEKGKFKEATLVKRFNEPYTYPHDTEYIGFIITDESKWKDDYFDEVVEGITTPLTVTSFLISDWETHQKNLVSSENKAPTKLTLPDININELEEVNNLLNNPTFQQEHNKLASEALASELKIAQKDRPNYKYDPIKLEKVAHYLALSGYSLLEDKFEEAEKVLKEAAVLHERLAILKLENNNSFEISDNIVSSALLYSIAGYNANAKVLVERILNREGIKDSLLSNTPIILLIYLLIGNLSQLQDTLAQFFSTFKQKNLLSVDESLEEDAWTDLLVSRILDVGDWMTAKAFAVLTQYLRTGDDIYQEAITKFITSATKQYLTIGNYSSYVLLNLIGRYFQILIKNSTQSLVRKYVNTPYNTWKLYLRFLCTLGKFPMMTLWKSQQKALQEGLLEDKSLVIAMPTSAGKTKTVELAIYKAVNEKKDKICVYVVPTKALAHEIEGSLSKSLSRVNIGVAILYGGYDLSELEEDILKDNQVFVLTPEKLDLLTRNSEEFKNKLALIIIDEAHDSTGSSPRSLRQELIYARLLSIAEKNRARVIGISAVVNNPHDFSKWLSGDEHNVVKIEWRPTKQRKGYLDWLPSTKARILYLRQPDDYPSEAFFVPLPFTAAQCRMKNKNGKYYRSNVVVAARLAIYYTQTGPTLVFTTTKQHVEAISECLITLLANQPFPLLPERQHIVDVCANVLGSDHLLVQSLTLGFCYHHSELPGSVRRLIENAVRDNIIPLIVSTTTLSQGVNLPIKNVIVHSLSLDRLVSMPQYANAVGRAGRAGCETEGHIIFCDFKDLRRVHVESDKEISESFIVSSIRKLVETRLLSLENTEDFLSLWALASTNQFRNAGEHYKDWTQKKQSIAKKKQSEILTLLDSQLLAWLLESCIDEVDEEKVEFIFKKLLCHVQSWDFSNELDAFKNAMKARIIAIKNEIVDDTKRKLFNFTGLSVKSNTIISAYAQQLAHSIDNYRTASELPNQFWGESYKVFQQIPELAENLKLKTVDALIDWIEGKDYKELADLHFNGKTEAVVNKLEKVSHAFAWGFNSLVRHLGFYLSDNELPNIFSNISSFVTNGVPNTGAVYAISLGVHERQLAIALSKAYYKNYKETIYSNFKEWLFNLEYEQWNLLTEANDIGIQKINDYFTNVQQRKRTLQMNQKVFECSFVIDRMSSNSIDNSLSLDQLIVVNLDQQLWLTTYDYRESLQLSGINTERIKQFDRQTHDFIVTNIDIQKGVVSIMVH